MVTDALLLTGLAATSSFVLVLLVEGALRPGYDPIYHTGSELELGDRGWIQRTNFIVMSAGTFAFAAGVQRSLDSTGGPVLLVVFGSGLIIAGVFPPDPVRGYPPGAPVDREADLSRGARIHDVSGPVMFLALLGRHRAGRSASRWLAPVHAADSGCRLRPDGLDCRVLPEGRSEHRARATRPHRRVLELDRGAGHPPPRGWTATLTCGDPTATGSSARGHDRGQVHEPVAVPA